MAITITSDAIFRNGVTLLAFVMAFYALVAKERKTPFMVHSVYRIIFIVLVALGASVIAELCPEDGWVNTQLLRKFASWILGGGLIYVYIKIWSEQNRHICFRSDHLLRNLTPVRYIQRVYGRLRRKPRYEHNPLPLPEKLIEDLRGSDYISTPELDSALEHHKQSLQMSISAFFQVHSLIQTDRLLCDLAIRFLENDCFVQYTCCSRHPLEFLLQLKSTWEKRSGRGSWKTMAEKIVIVDGYSPHFGFTDTIYNKSAEIAENDCIKVVSSKPTFAGIHTAIANAFNEIKCKDGGQVRTPTLVIYEGCNAISDVESAEQYRVFFRHVIPSERLWGGMFTVVVESHLPEESEKLLTSLVHITSIAPPLPTGQ